MSMIWSIFKNSSLSYEQWEINDAAWFVDQDIEASPFNRVKFLHDGFYPIHFGRGSTQGEVKDGKWVDIATLKERIGALVSADGYWGQYIEGFEKRDGNIVVLIGS